MKTIISAKADCEIAAAEYVKKLIEDKPDAVIAFAGGRSMEGFYSRLLDMFEAQKLSFSRVRALLVGEFVNAPREKSCAASAFDGFLCHTDIEEKNLFLPDTDRPEDYDALIERLGGLDLVILGLGENAHIGFNEPATPYASLCHVQKLTDAARRQYASQFGGEDRVPEKAFTMGIKTITSAKEILLLAFGGRKAEAVHKMLYGRNDSVVPAAFLQIPMNVTVYLDEAASSQL